MHRQTLVEKANDRSVKTRVKCDPIEARRADTNFRCQRCQGLAAWGQKIKMPSIRYDVIFRCTGERQAYGLCITWMRNQRVVFGAPKLYGGCDVLETIGRKREAKCWRSDNSCFDAFVRFTC